jgi:hypothetical protein
MNTDKLSLSEQIVGAVRRTYGNGQLPDTLKLKGLYRTEHIRNGKLIGVYDAPNTIVNVGKNYILDVMFNGGTQIANIKWFMGFISSGSFSAISAADTMSSHSGWTEFTTYTVSGDNSVRPPWGPGTASSQSVTNASAVTIDITSNGTVKGIFIVGAASGAVTKGGTSGTLWSAALYTGGDVSVLSSDQLRSTYTLNA